MQSATIEISGVLSEFGLSDFEASVYQACLSLGSRPASVIAKKAGLKRGHTYNLLRSLMEKGLVQEYTRNNTRHYVSSPPETLLSINKRREIELLEQRKRLTAIIPHLVSMSSPLSSEPTVRFFRGLEGVKEVLEEMLRFPNEIIYGFSDWRHSWSALGDERVDEYVRDYVQRREELGVMWKGIFISSGEAERAITARPSRLRMMKRLEGEEISFPADIHVINHKSAFITRDADKVVAVVIDNDSIADTLRGIHSFLWASLPEIYPEYGLAPSTQDSIN